MDVRFGLLVAAVVSAAFPGPVRADPDDNDQGSERSFHLQEATIGDVHHAIRTGRLTCTQLVQLYLDRIRAYNGVCVGGQTDAQGRMLSFIFPIFNNQLNALSTLNLRPPRLASEGFAQRYSRTLTPQANDPNDAAPDKPDALEVAAQLDDYFARTGKLIGPLHCVPFVVKDIMNTREMRSTDGTSSSIWGNDRPPDDATVVARLRSAGAVILAKSNSDDMQTGNQGRSSFGGQTCNPYEPSRVPGGSSAGSAVAVAANLVMCATAHETWGSVRNPASNNNIVGLLPSRGLLSSARTFPNSAFRDRPGVHCRNVHDTAVVLDALKGVDPADDDTAASIGRIPAQPYARAARAKAEDLAGLRIGVIRDFMIEFTPADRDSLRLMNQAIGDLKSHGAVVVDVSFQDAIADIVPIAEPAFLESNFPRSFLDGAGNPIPPIDQENNMILDHSLFPSGNFGLNLRRLQSFFFFQNEIKQSLSRYLRRRGDAQVKTFDDMVHDPNRILDTEYDERFCANVTNIAGGKCDGQTPGHIPNPQNDGTNVDPFGTFRDMTQRRLTLQRILLKVMSDNQLVALAYPYKNVPANAMTALPSFVIDFENALGPFNEWTGGWNTLGPVAGVPDIVVPAGFVQEVFDIVLAIPSVNGKQPFTPNTNDTLSRGYFFFANVERNPNVGPLPFAIDFMARPFDEPTLFRVAAAYEDATRHRSLDRNSRLGHLRQAEEDQDLPTFVTFDVPNTVLSFAAAINDRGAIVGRYCTADASTCAQTGPDEGWHGYVFHHCPAP